jgi:hypothetical protein
VVVAATIGAVIDARAEKTFYAALRSDDEVATLRALAAAQHRKFILDRILDKD